MLRHACSGKGLRVLSPKALPSGDAESAWVLEWKEPSCAPRLKEEKTTLLASALIEAFERHLSEFSRLVPVEVGLGRRFSYVYTDSGHLGLAYAPQDEPIPAKILSAPSLIDIVRYAWQHPVASSLALAAANAAMSALIDRDRGVVRFGGDVVEELGVGAGDRVALVGYVEGVASALIDRGARLVVYEDNPMHRRWAERSGLTVLPGSQIVLGVEDYDYLIATGASLIDPRLVHVLLEARGKKSVRAAVVGPSSSFHPYAAVRLGFNVIAGSYVPRVFRETVLRLVKAGYGFRAIRGFVEKWVWGG
ncbi:MAG: hypothetical protein DSY37_02955 [Hyperthermus sp.]|nr:MAG: hypothetical protein DSY37_02955 [Hyperthermus sp.]